MSYRQWGVVIYFCIVLAVVVSINGAMVWLGAPQQTWLFCQTLKWCSVRPVIETRQYPFVLPVMWPTCFEYHLDHRSTAQEMAFHHWRLEQPISFVVDDVGYLAIGDVEFHRADPLLDCTALVADHNSTIDLDDQIVLSGNWQVISVSITKAMGLNQEGRP